MKEIQKFIRQYQELIVSVAIVLGIGAGVLWGLIPAVQKTLSLRSQLQELSLLVSALQQKSEVLTGIDEVTYQRMLIDLSLAVPSDKSLTSLFATIDGLSNVTGVSVLEVSLAKPGGLATDSARKQSGEEQKIGSNLLPFSVTVAGSFEQIRNFLEVSIKVRRFFRVRNFDIAFVNPSNITVKMGMDAFFAPLPTNLGSVEQPITALSDVDNEVMAQMAKFPIVGQELINTVLPDGSPITSPPTFRENPFEP